MRKLHARRQAGSRSVGSQVCRPLRAALVVGAIQGRCSALTPGYLLFAPSALGRSIARRSRDGGAHCLLCSRLRRSPLHIGGSATGGGGGVGLGGGEGW